MVSNIVQISAPSRLQLKGGNKMPSLVCCYLQVFGSNFDAEKFSSQVGLPEGDVFFPKSKDPKPRSPIKAIQRGNVAYWQTKRKFFSKDSIINYEIFHEVNYENEFLIQYVRDNGFLNKFLIDFVSDSLEIWLVVIYEARSDTRPTGCFISRDLIKELSVLNCSISTDYLFDGDSTVA